MAVSISKANPLRFRKQGGTSIDYSDTYPQFDLMENKTDYQKGIYSVPNYYCNFPLDSYIRIQIQSSVAPTGLLLRNMSDNTTLTTFNIEGIGDVAYSNTKTTPSGWVGDDIYYLVVVPDVEGVYRLEFTVSSDIYYSDEFIVYDSSVKKELIHIQYYDTDNKFGGVFSGDGAWIWRPEKYVTGQIIIGEGNKSYSLYQDDSGITYKLNAEVVDGMLINITDVSQYEKVIIDRIFGCDNILINGVAVQTSDPPEYNPIDKTDLCNISIRATLTDSDQNLYNF
jgi:hypothetical protein